VAFLFQRLIFAAIGLIAGNVALLALLLYNAMRMRAVLLKMHMGQPFLQLPQAWESFVLYAGFSIVGWAAIGLPIVLALPPRRLSRLPWPLYLLIGAALGPLALLFIFFVLAAMQGQLNTFSLSHTESFWPLSILVSTVSFLVYAALVRGRFLKDAS
jgi:hypothetical protein